MINMLLPPGHELWPQVRGDFETGFGKIIVQEAFMGLRNKKSPQNKLSAASRLSTLIFVGDD